jgi:hypothetical protein
MGRTLCCDTVELLVRTARSETEWELQYSLEDAKANRLSRVDGRTIGWMGYISLTKVG